MFLNKILVLFFQQKFCLAQLISHEIASPKFPICDDTTKINGIETGIKSTIICISAIKEIETKSLEELKHAH